MLFVFSTAFGVLAAGAGVAIVAVGGGGIKTMSQRWEAVAAKYDEEKPKIAEAARNAPSVKEQAQQAKDKAKGQGQGTRPSRAPPAHAAPGSGGHPIEGAHASPRPS